MKKEIFRQQKKKKNSPLTLIVSGFSVEAF